MKLNEIYRIYGTAYKQMTMQLLEEADLASLIRQKYPEKANPRIAIKPNLVSPTPASFGATTHPEIVDGILAYLIQHQFTNLLICEGSWVGDKTGDAFLYCGYQALADAWQVPLFDTQKDRSFKAVSNSPNPLDLKLCSCLSGIDFLINVPVLKGHCQTKVTCALKNMKGLIPNTEKRRFHSLGLHRPIAHLNTLIRQDFIVIDHICGDPDFEDGGNPLVRNCILTARDPVLADALACRILHYEPEDVEYILLAEQLGVGSRDLSSLVLRTFALQGANPADTRIPEEELFPEAELSDAAAGQPMETHFDVASASHRMLELNYAVEEIESCSACYSALIGALDRLHREGRLHTLTDRRNLRFCIGQGYREKTSADECTAAEEGSVTRIGIGSCTSSFEKNIPGCPPSEDTIYEYLLPFSEI